MPMPPEKADIFDEVCARIASGESLVDITSQNDMPSYTTVMRWLAEDETGELRDKYARAREDQADVLADEIITIADDARNDWMAREGEGDAGYALNGEHVQRSRLRIDARKWVASKLKPKKYGDKLDHNVSGTVSVNFNTVYEAKPDS